MNRSGQASADYVAIVALVGVVLAVAASALAKPPDLAHALARHVRTALCVVGGDVCRAADAAAAGLDPCVTAEDTRNRSGGGSFLVFRANGHETWTYERRSDGTVAFTAADGIDGGLTAGVGVSITPNIRAEASGGASYGWRDGRTWEFSNRAAAEPFLRAMRRAEFDHTHPSLPPATFRFDRRAGHLDAGVVGIPALRATLAAATGHRHGRDGSTVSYFEAEGALPSLLGHLVDGTRAAGGFELARAPAGELRSLTLRTVSPGPRSGRSTEVAVQLDLRDPANRAAVERLLAARPPWAPDLFASMPGLRQRLRTAATVERRVYREQRDRGGIDLAFKVGLEIGINSETETVERDLESATVRFPGERAQRRFDCTL